MALVRAKCAWNTQHAVQLHRLGSPGSLADMERETPLTRDSARHAAELLELGDAFFELDRDWRIVRVNRRQEALSGRPRAETLGRTFAEVWPELYDAFAGLEKALEGLPEIVLCDIGLPGMDGYEFARQFRAMSQTQHVRLVALTGYAQPEDVTKAVEAGFYAHVAKPPDPEEIASLLG